MLHVVCVCPHVLCMLCMYVCTCGVYVCTCGVYVVGVCLYMRCVCGVYVVCMWCVYVVCVQLPGGACRTGLRYNQAWLLSVCQKVIICQVLRIGTRVDTVER